jgi:uncharacterized SAM-binding protein YcdF (DUF218 family)
MKRLKQTSAGLAFALLVLVTGCGKDKNLQPDAIFVLGGATERERFAAKFAQQHPDLPIWVSSGSPKTMHDGCLPRQELIRVASTWIIKLWIQ